MGSFSATRANHGFIIRTVLIAVDAVTAESVSFGGATWKAKGSFFAGELVHAVIVVSSMKRAFSPNNGMGFDFLGYGSWVLAKGIGNTGISHFVVQRILDDFTVLSSQVLILFHSQSLLKTEMQQKKNNTKSCGKRGKGP
jgi:hypothetical protein